MSRSQPGMASRQALDASHTRPPSAEKQAPRNGHIAAGQISNQAVGQARSSGVPLESQVRAEMETRFGTSFDDVRIHDDENANRSAADLEAKAYTHGRDITFSAGRYAPNDVQGRHLLAHELAHVVQQRRGGPAPEITPTAPLEAAADRAATAVTKGAGPVVVAGATGVGVAREAEDEDRKKKNQAGPVRRVGPGLKPKAQPDKVTITDPKKATGVLGEVTTPFAVYSDPDWNILGGGQETSSSRLSLARRTRWGDTAGLDNLIQHRKTNRLVIGEQKRLGSKSFTKATAITTNLEKNIDNTVKRLLSSIKRGGVHPDEIANVKNVAERLKQTSRALKSRTALPEEVVFELTATGGKSTKIGKDYVAMLAEKFGDPKYVEHLLSRTYIRDPQLARSMGRDPHGIPGTNTDPHVVPAKDAMTDAAKSELERLLAGKTPKEWEDQKAKEKQAQAEERKRARKAERETKAAERERIKTEAKKAADETRQKTLEELRQEAVRKGDSQPKTKAEKRAADNDLKKKATKAGKDAQKKVLDEARERAKAAAQQKKPAAEKSAKGKSDGGTKAKPEADAPKAERGAVKAEPVSPKPEAVQPKAKAVAPTAESGKPTLPLEVKPGGITPKGVASGALSVAGGLAALSGLKDIINEFKQGHVLAGAAKTGLLGLSFVGEAAPPLFALGVAMNYWGPRHDKIEEDSFKAGKSAEESARNIPLLGRSETVRRVFGGLAAAETAVEESIAYTVKDMGSAVVEGAEIVGDIIDKGVDIAGDVIDEGAEIVGGAVEDAYDWLTAGPSMFDLMNEELKRRRGD